MGAFMRLPGAVAAVPAVLFSVAAAAAPLDLQTRFPYYHTTISLDDDGRATETREWSRVVLKEAALEAAKTASVSWSTSAQTGEILSAYTLKADGRRIDVPKDNYQLEINRGKGTDSPLYSDQTELSVMFPELAVGDTVVFSYRVSETEPLFPGKFSATEAFGSQLAYDDVRVRIDYPASLQAQYDSQGMEQVAAEQADGRRSVEWRYANPAPVKSERKNWSVYDLDHETHYSFSTFTSYAEIASAYGARAAPKAEPTDRIRQLAAEIVGGAGSPREQAHALYDWVATHISYAGNCIGVGAVVPRDLAVVLDNHIGDCKDHATLLQALLAARGIPSTQVLINAGSVYRLPKVPVVSTVNHVINYIPSLGLYADSTSSYTPFGLLPGGDQGKPVLLVDGFRADSHTPVLPPDANSETNAIRFSLAADGSLSGSEEAFERGESAAAMRAWARRLTRNYEDEFVHNMFSSENLVGEGHFSKDDPTALADSYHYSLDYKVQRFIKLPGAGAFYVSPPSGNALVSKMLQFEGEVETQAEVVCHGGAAREEYTMQFPQGMRILSVPDDVDVSNDYLSYRASYRLKGRSLSVQRVLADKLPGPTCTPQVVAAYKKLGDVVQDDLRSQVLYKLPKKRNPG